MKIIEKEAYDLDPQKTNHFKQQLLQEQKNIQETIRRMDHDEPNSSLREYYGELSAYDNHPADMGTETFEMEMNFNLKNNERLRLEEINHALERLEEGSYGQCITCGEDIEEERLEILPTALQCIACEEKELPASTEKNTRPVEEEVLSPPFGRTDKDFEEDYNGFDGEDAWQQVARVNKTDAHRMALDWYDNNMYDEEVSGITESVDSISNEYYRGQLKNDTRKDIPSQQQKKKN